MIRFIKIRGFKFILIVLFLYVLIFLFDFSHFSLINTIFIRIVLNLLPLFGLIMILMPLFNIIINKKTIKSNLRTANSIKLWIFSIIGGILSTGPVYIWYPLLSDLRDKGLKYRYIVAFIYNRAIKLPLIPVLIYYLNAKLVLILFLIMIIFSVIDGLVVEWLMEKI